MTKKVIDKELKNLHKEFDKLCKGRKFRVHFINGVDIECRLERAFGLCFECTLKITKIILISKDKKAEIIYNYLYCDDWNNNELLFDFCLNEGKTLVNKYKKDMASFNKKCKEYYHKTRTHYDESEYYVWWDKEFSYS